MPTLPKRGKNSAMKQIRRNVVFMGALVFGLVACKSSPIQRSASYQMSLADLPKAQTQATLAGPLCEGDFCRCRSEEESAGEPDKGKTRYEIRLGEASQPLWLRFGDSQLYKSAERISDCFYIDVAPGKFPVALIAGDDKGIAAGVQITELQQPKEGWQEVFRFQCGTPGACEAKELAAWGQQAKKSPLRSNVPCVATTITGINWNSQNNPDYGAMAKLALSFTLDNRDVSQDECGEESP